MNPNILNYIITVSEEKNFTRAAEKLYISQPSLSQIIKKEEEKLGIQIFDRNNYPIKLTPAGHEYVLWARQVLSLQDKMYKRLSDFATNEKVFLKIGILPECSSFILPEPLQIFYERNPKSSIEIIELDSIRLLSILESSEVDFIIGITPKNTHTYTIEPLYEEKIVLALTPEFHNKYYDMEEIDLKEFYDTPFITTRKPGSLHNLTHSLCKRNGFVPNTVIQCSNFETIMKMVGAGIGVSLIPDFMSYMIKGLTYRHVKDFDFTTEISIMYNPDSHLTKEALTLIQLIKNNLLNRMVEAKNQRNFKFR